MKVDLQAHLTAAVMSFRVGMEAKGNQELAQLVEAIALELAQGCPPAGSAALAGLLGETDAALGRGDFLYAADLLQFEIAPIFGATLTHPLP